MFEENLPDTRDVLQNGFKTDFFLFSFVIKCLRPYHVEHTSSRLITEVKQHWAKLVLGWVTAWEYLVL